MLLDYAVTYPNAVIHYNASDMVLHLDPEAAYLTMPEERSCYVGIFYLSRWPSLRPVKTTLKRNGPIHTEWKTIHNVVSSAAEAEAFEAFNIGKTAIDMRPYLITLDRKQPFTPLKTENPTTEVFVNSGMKPKRSNTWDMKWHWLRDKELLEQLILYWDRGTNNDTDYLTKHHPPIHHRQTRPRYIHTLNLVRKISETIRLYKGVLNWVPCTQSCIRYNSLKPIRTETQSTT